MDRFFTTPSGAVRSFSLRPGSFRDPYPCGHYLRPCLPGSNRAGRWKRLPGVCACNKSLEGP